MSPTTHLEIRRECLQPALYWSRPTGAEIQEIVRRAGMSGRKAEAYLGLSGKSDGRQIRKWISQESLIPYAAWALLCDAAGLGQIWRINSDAL
ncbi:XRE family transcriptional regulator [Burkholderia sp. Ac-20353]|uniref:XRE family transcriptional regulator n=1 Tax=Burkholderia sp. Ac-20353 TaxID=2703894 RepID=UPI00197BBA97|nr:XRE family transcriptional regulator [Burkholderia sp. Ac-20353]MBN3785568.1 XRE family transcriptional regulator [Burkholderia sp. Ac-20353]